MENLITVIHVLAAAGVIGLVLLQHGKGADMGAAFGSGASGSLFGVSGSSNILSKLTAICVLVFFCTSLTLAYMASHRSGNGSVIKMSPENAQVNDVKKNTLSTETKSTDAAPSSTAGSTAKDIPN